MPQIYQPAEDSFLLLKVLEKEIPKLIKKNQHLQFLEIGSGSGIILETVQKLGIKREHIYGVDINQEAVQHCQKLGFNCIYSNLFEKVSGKFNIIVFNPPYLPKDQGSEIKFQAKSTKNVGREPADSQIATTGGAEGSEIINEFLKQAENYLEENARIFLLTSSLTKNINWRNYSKRLLGKEKLFFEELKVWELKR